MPDGFLGSIRGGLLLFPIYPFNKSSCSVQFRWGVFCIAPFCEPGNGLMQRSKQHLPIGIRRLFEKKKGRLTVLGNLRKYGGLTIERLGDPSAAIEAFTRCGPDSNFLLTDAVIHRFAHTRYAAFKPLGVFKPFGRSQVFQIVVKRT